MTHWHLTTLEVALTAPLFGAPIGALITVLAQRSSNHANLATQRELSAQSLAAQRALGEDERLWTKRAELYARASDVINEPLDVTIVGDANYFDYSTARGLPQRWVSIKALDGQFRSFADPSTVEAWTAYADVWYQISQSASAMLVDDAEANDSSNDFELRQRSRQIRNSEYANLTARYQESWALHHALMSTMRDALIGEA